MICPLSPWYWPFHRFRPFFSPYNPQRRMCDIGQLGARALRLRGSEARTMTILFDSIWAYQFHRGNGEGRGWAFLGAALYFLGELFS